MLVGLLLIIQLLTWVIIARALLSWVFTAGIRNNFLFSIDRALGAITSPIMKPIQRYLPKAGNVDFSPMVAIILLYIFSRILLRIFL